MTVPSWFERKWHRFFFETRTPPSLYLFRILFGFFVFWMWLREWPGLLPIFGPNAIVGMKTVQEHPAPFFELFSLFPRSDLWVYFLYSLLLVSALCLTIGLKTRLSSAVLFVNLVWFENRGIFVATPVDDLAAILAFVMIFCDSGARLSADRLLLRGAQRANRSPSSPWAVRLIQIQVSWVYLEAVFEKLHSPVWRDGTAVSFALKTSSYSWLMDWLGSWSLAAIRTATWGTLIIELGLGILLWVPSLSNSLVVVGILFHALTAILIGRTDFQLLMMASLLLFARGILKEETRDTRPT